ncbi:MAG: hypothetical protein ACFCGT_20375 [Sandaracinaceae bacterium]
MRRRRSTAFGLAVGSLAGLLALSWFAHALWPTPQAREAGVFQVEVLGGPDAPASEVSGLAWYGDRVVLLPQHPERLERGPALFAIERRELEAYVERRGGPPVEARRVPLALGADLIGHPRFDGFEALVFDADRVVLAVELLPDPEGHGGTGLLVRGHVLGDLDEVALDPSFSVELPAQTGLQNIGYEALLTWRNHLYALYEVNGAPNPAPRAVVLDSELRVVRQEAFPPLEYRLTDATAPDPDGRFWVTNYHWPGSSWEPGACALTERFGLGESHARCPQVERLVEMAIGPDGFRVTGRPPVLLELVDDEHPRNWEGVARFGDGFLVVTDTYPEPILAYVPR